jgi:short subunit dehydrogenase-like uncharacterized protein
MSSILGALKNNDGLLSPYWLNPNDDQRYPPTLNNIPARDQDRILPYSSELFPGKVLGFFLLCPTNEKIVRRSFRLTAKSNADAHPYGKDFYYHERVDIQYWILGYLIPLLMGILALLGMFSWTQNLLKIFLPKPGEGPSKETREKTKFSLEIAGRTENGRVVRYRVHGREPGYTETAMMVSECALALAYDREKMLFQGGVLTPASAFGELIVERINKSPSMRFTAS